MSALARFLEPHTTRAALIASFKAATLNGVPLNEASLAGKALFEHDDVDTARASLAGDEWVRVGARAYLRIVAEEERAPRTEAPVRYRPAISDEDDR